MTENELRQLPLDKLFEFTLYYGAILIGYPACEADGWYIIRKTSDSETKKKVLPSQIESYKTITRNNLQQKKQPHSISITGTPKSKILVIVGAGASYNYSFNDSVSKPPLAKDLFNNHYENFISQFPGVENLSSQILQAKDVEVYFQQQWEKIIRGYNPILLNKLIDVQFYLHYLFQRASNGIDFRTNNYSGFFQALRDYLIDKGDHQKALVVSFNYDTILEQSLTRAFNYKYTSLGDYVNISDRRFLLFKPHGSWNWIKNFNTDFLTSLSITIDKPVVSMNNRLYEKQISLGTILSNLSDEPEIFNSNGAPYYFPHLLIPYRTKDSFVMPDNHLLFLEYFLDQVEKIIILGWKGTEEKFKELLKRKLGDKPVHVLYVTANDQTVEKELKDVLKGATFTEVSPYKESKGTFTELNSFIQEYPEKIFE